jgi:hypothetical protein
MPDARQSKQTEAAQVRGRIDEVTTKVYIDNEQTNVALGPKHVMKGGKPPAKVEKPETDELRSQKNT